MAGGTQLRMFREQFERCFDGSRVIERQRFIPLARIPASLRGHIGGKIVGNDDAQAHVP